MFKIGDLDLSNAAGYLITGEITRKLDPKTIVLQNPLAPSDTQVANVFNAIQEWSVPLRIYSTTGYGADLAAKISALNAELTKDTNTLQESLERNITGAPDSYWEMVKSAPLLPGRGELTEKRLLVEDTIVIRTKATCSDGSGAVTDTGAVTGADLVVLTESGDTPMPLAVELSRTGGISSAVVAVVPADAVIGDYDTGLTGELGGTGDPAALSVVMSPAGRYEIVARVEWVSGTPLLGAGQDSTTVPAQWAEILNTTPALVDLGQLSSNGSTTLDVFVTGGVVSVLDVYLVPLALPVVSAWGLPHGVASLVFAQGANSQPLYTVGDGLTAPPGAQQLLVIADPAGVEVAVGASYVPAWYGWAFVAESES